MQTIYANMISVLHLAPLKFGMVWSHLLWCFCCGQTRKIKELPVFVVTTSFSIFVRGLFEWSSPDPMISDMHQHDVVRLMDTICWSPAGLGSCCFSHWVFLWKFTRPKSIKNINNIYLEPNWPLFWGLTFHFMGQPFRNMGHLGSRYIMTLNLSFSMVQ